MGVGFYFFNELYLNKENNKEYNVEEIPSELFEFENYNEGLSEQNFEKYKERFLIAKQVVEENSDSLNPSFWMEMAKMKKYVNDFEGAEEIYKFLLKFDRVNYSIE